MINYLEKYNNLPKEIKDKISAPHVMEAIHDMEKRYSVNLATVVMRVMVKDIRIDELRSYFVYTVNINADKAVALIDELRKKVFSEISNYLDYINEVQLNASEKLKLKDNSKTEFEEQQEESAEGANFYFSIEDEDEVRSQAKDFSKYDRREQVSRRVEFKIDKIISKINVIFSSEDMLQRLKRVLHTYLHGVRDKIDAKQTLERPIDKGGLGLDEEISDDILKIVDLINLQETSEPSEEKLSKKAPAFKVPEDKAQPQEERITFDSQSIVDVEYDFSKLGSKTEEQDIEEDVADGNRDVRKHLKEDDHNDNIENLKSIGHLGEDEPGATDLVLDLSSDSPEEESGIEPLAEEEKKVVNNNDKKEDKDEAKSSKKTEQTPSANSKQNFSVSSEKAPVDSKKDDVEDKKDKHIAEDKPLRPQVPIARARTKPSIKIDYDKKLTVDQNNEGKIRMDDIKKVHKLGGPLEEVGSMDLQDFKRFGEVEIAIKKIMNMFTLLEEDSFNKKMAGIKAWRQSPLNKLYLSVGQESMMNQKDVKQIIEKREKEGKEYLSQEEFDAIMELNKRLRY